MEILKTLYNIIDVKCLKHARVLDELVTSNLRNSGIETRPTKSNGLWCFLLLPTILILYTKQYPVSDGYRLATYLSIGLACYSILFIMFLSMSSHVLTDTLYSGCLPSAIAACVFMYLHFKKDAMFCAVFSMPSTFLYLELLRRLLRFPKTFTIGEAMIMSQAVFLLLAVLGAKSFCNFGQESDKTDFIDVVVATVLSTVGLLVAALHYMRPHHRNLATLWYLMGLAATVELILLYVFLGWTSIPYLIGVAFGNSHKRMLICLWAFLVFVSVVVLTARTQMGVKATTTTRKLFHVMAAAVFATGILLDEGLMRLAAGAGFGLLIFVEALRKSEIEPVSSALQSAFHIYSDEKDCGAFAMTPIYLYVGLACPLWLAPSGACAVERLAGVLATGVGDTAASWFGSRYGQLKWPGGNRTLEGTAFNVLSQIVVMYFLILFDLMPCKNALIRTAIAAAVSSLVEAKTHQVDNLILPLVTLIAFQATHYLS